VIVFKRTSIIDGNIIKLSERKNIFQGDDNLIEERLRESAAKIRDIYIKKPILHQPFLKITNNVAVAEVHIQGNVIFHEGGTSHYKSPIPKPKPKSEGGQFEPGIDSRTNRLMDTDAEYKVLSAIADALQMHYDLQVEGELYLYTERQPCESCNNVLRQFEDKFPNIKITVFWDYPYSP
jgi:The  BURPS668_1122 family of deaminases